MSRGAIAAAFAAYLVVTLAFGFVLEWVQPLAASQEAPAFVGRALEMALGAFVVPGILPLLAWGFSRFRAEKAAGSLFVWGVLGLTYMILAGLGNFWDQKIQISRTDDNIVRLDGSVHATLVRSINQGCVANQTRRRARNPSVTDQQINAFCRCFANSIAGEVTNAEIMEIVKTGKPPASFQRKANAVSPACIRIALGQ